jgi:hypothetical protein
LLTLRSDLSIRMPFILMERKNHRLYQSRQPLHRPVLQATLRTIFCAYRPLLFGERALLSLNYLFDPRFKIVRR